MDWKEKCKESVVRTGLFLALVQKKKNLKKVSVWSLKGNQKVCKSAMKGACCFWLACVGVMATKRLPMRLASLLCHNHISSTRSFVSKDSRAKTAAFYPDVSNCPNLKMYQSDTQVSISQDTKSQNFGKLLKSLLSVSISIHLQHEFN